MTLGAVLVLAFVLALSPASAQAHSPSISVGVAPASFSPDGDGRADVTRVSMRLWRATYVSATILDAGKVIHKLPPATMRAGMRSLVWNGRLADGSVASWGPYEVRIAARGFDRHWRIVRLPVKLLPPPTPPLALQWPISGAVTSGFGQRHGSMHHGIDIPAPSMTPIGAAAPGRVRTAAFISGYGNTVILDHADGRATLYAHMAKLGVAAGAKVVAGQLLGYVGQTGSTTTAHLHFELHAVGGTPIDPLPHLPPQQPAS